MIKNYTLSISYVESGRWHPIYKSNEGRDELDMMGMIIFDKFYPLDSVDIKEYPIIHLDLKIEWVYKQNEDSWKWEKIHNINNSFEDISNIHIDIDLRHAVPVEDPRFTKDDLENSPKWFIRMIRDIYEKRMEVVNQPSFDGEENQLQWRIEFSLNHHRRHYHLEYLELDLFNFNCVQFKLLGKSRDQVQDIKDIIRLLEESEESCKNKRITHCIESIVPLDPRNRNRIKEGKFKWIIKSKNERKLMKVWNYETFLKIEKKLYCIRRALERTYKSLIRAKERCKTKSLEEYGFSRIMDMCEMEKEIHSLV